MEKLSNPVSYSTEGHYRCSGFFIACNSLNNASIIMLLHRQTVWVHWLLLKRIPIQTDMQHVSITENIGYTVFAG
ncbi:MAG: hypothetical protein EO766_10530 [Hydrotalea sp. AMD]|uniref:hypothetical protein n=1 Tax=Hydrotalea sp. AMD TaxID=2501297 RepID=UPI000943A620|nr:hypothetical protein [Hydrotalea sp. AMD]RWZ87555.1 MAG: hypothetical protein EO766_10530 [Hydrotalea sp. AMD]